MIQSPQSLIRHWIPLLNGSKQLKELVALASNRVKFQSFVNALHFTLEQKEIIIIMKRVYQNIKKIKRPSPSSVVLSRVTQLKNPQLFLLNDRRY